MNKAKGQQELNLTQSDRVSTRIQKSLKELGLPPLMSTDKVVGYIYESTNYDQFKRLEGNRDVTNARKEKIKRSVEAVGQRESCVTVNSKMEIIDGQGRVDAFADMQLPVHYVFDPDAGLRECQHLNVGMSNWTLPNFIGSYAVCGNEDYIFLQELIAQYNKTLLPVIVWTVCNGTYNSSVDPVKEGQFKVRLPKKKITEKLDYLQRYVPHLMEYGGRTREALIALSFCYDQEGIDRERLFEKVVENLPGNPSFQSVRFALRWIEKKYSKGLRTKIIHFESLFDDEERKNRRASAKARYSKKGK